MRNRGRWPGGRIDILADRMTKTATLQRASTVKYETPTSLRRIRHSRTHGVIPIPFLLRPSTVTAKFSTSGIIWPPHCEFSKRRMSQSTYGRTLCALISRTRKKRTTKCHSCARYTIMQTPSPCGLVRTQRSGTRRNALSCWES